MKKNISIEVEDSTEKMLNLAKGVYEGNEDFEELLEKEIIKFSKNIINRFINASSESDPDWSANYTDDEKVSRRLNKWAGSKGQKNHIIIQSFFETSNHDEGNLKASKTAMREYCKSYNGGKTFTETSFNGCFAALCSNGGNSSGKIFDVGGDIVTLNEKNRKEVISRKDDFLA